MADPTNVPGLSFASFPPELMAEASALSRRRALLAALAANAGHGASGMTVPNKFGDMYVPPNPWAAIASTVAPIAATYAADKGQTELATKYQTGLVNALRKYREDQQVSPQTAEDTALTGGYGPVAALANRDASDRQKLVAEILKTPEASLGSRARLAQRLTSGGGPADLGSGLQAHQFGQIEPDAGGIGAAGQKELDTGQYHIFPRPPQTNINLGQNEFAKEQARIVGKRLEKGMEAANESRGDLQTLQTALNAYNQGITTGSFQGARNSIERALVTMNFMDDKGNQVANTDTFLRTMAGRLLKHTAELRPLSEPDRQFLEKIYAGQDLGPKAMEKLFEVGIENSIRTIDAHNSFVESLPEGEPGVQPTGLELLPGSRQAYRIHLPMTDLATPDNPQGTFRMHIGPRPEDFGGKKADGN